MSRWPLHALIQLVYDEILKCSENSALYLCGVREALAPNEKKQRTGKSHHTHKLIYTNAESKKSLPPRSK